MLEVKLKQNEHLVQEHDQKLEHQRVEHWSLVYVVTVTRLGRSTHATINGERHKVYPSGNEKELWTTNISLGV